VEGWRTNRKEYKIPLAAETVTVGIGFNFVRNEDITNWPSILACLAEVSIYMTVGQSLRALQKVTFFMLNSGRPYRR
jgi:hypothetical protein